MQEEIEEYENKLEEDEFQAGYIRALELKIQDLELLLK